MVAAEVALDLLVFSKTKLTEKKRTVATNSAASVAESAAAVAVAVVDVSRAKRTTASHLQLRRASSLKTTTVSRSSSPACLK